MAETTSYRTWGEHDSTASLLLPDSGFTSANQTDTKLAPRSFGANQFLALIFLLNLMPALTIHQQTHMKNLSLPFFLSSLNNLSAKLKGFFLVAVDTAICV